jgi:transposase-like protein
MGKRAKKTAKSQVQPAANQRTVKLAEFVRRNLMTFVIREGMKALDEMLEQDRVALCGPAHAKGAEGDPVRWGSTNGRLVLGGQRVIVRKPRVRRDGKEVELPAWAEFADDDPLDERTFEQLVLGVSTRKYERSLDELPDELEAHGASKSAASRRFVETTSKQVSQWMKRDLSKRGIVVVMLDGIIVAKHTVVVGLGIDETGKKHALGLWIGETENAVVCGELLDNLIERGLDPLSPHLFVIDGSKALRKAIRTRFGERSLVQRCQTHKRENILGHLPKSLHASVNKALSDAFKGKTRKAAKTRLLTLAKQLLEDHPDAAASIKEGLDEVLTLKDMKLPLALEKTLSTTNPIENLNGSIRDVGRRVKRWRNGAMIKRWVATGILEAEKRFHRVKGKKGMPILIEALRKHAARIDNLDLQQEAA